MRAPVVADYSAIDLVTVRLMNRRQLQRLRPDLIDHDPEAIFEVTSDDGLCLTLGRLVRDAELSAA
ncbi:MAG: hypothetical protein QOE61_527 [Micromonosporaceae bacterium]|jgi:hypothetical protein|nr:hypothetical protein [Micromonosporaceae bacterium]